MTSKTNKIISAVVAIAIIISAIILIYVNLPKQTETTEEDNTNPPAQKEAPAALTLVYNDEQFNYTFGQIERLESYTAKGGYINSIGMIKGVGNYTGVNITTLVKNLEPSPYHYSIQIFTEDEKNMSYNYSTIIGQVPIFSPENGTPIGIGNMTLVLAYQYEGNPLNETSDGQFRIVLLDKNGSITESKYWMKMVTSIRIITE